MERDAAVTDIEHLGYSDWEILAKETLREVPLVDAEIVVRCKECLYAREKYGHIECSNGISYQNTYNDPDMYCSYGQRREAVDAN